MIELDSLFKYFAITYRWRDIYMDKGTIYNVFFLDEEIRKKDIGIAIKKWIDEKVTIHKNNIYISGRWYLSNNNDYVWDMVLETPIYIGNNEAYLWLVYNRRFKKCIIDKTERKWCTMYFDPWYGDYHNIKNAIENFSNVKCEGDGLNIIGLELSYKRKQLYLDKIILNKYYEIILSKD